MTTGAGGEDAPSDAHESALALTPQAPQQVAPQQTRREDVSGTEVTAEVGETVSPTGRREAFRDVRRRLTDEDLSAPGVQKMLLDELEHADVQCEELREYVKLYHDADKRAAVSDEKLRTNNALEVLFASGLAIGACIIGLSPSLWVAANPAPTQEALLLGALLVIGSIIGRVVKR